MTRAAGTGAAAPGALALAAAVALVAACHCGKPAPCPADAGLPVTFVDPAALCDGVTPAPGVPALALEEVAGGLDSPVWVGAPPGDVTRLFVVEQRGTVRLLRDGVLLERPFLDLRSRVSCCGEQGLLSLAFPPDFAATGLFYADFTNNAGNTVVAEYAVCDDPDMADAATERELLRVNQPYANHNGGQLAFGPDGYLYVALGDGGSGGDPGGRGQDLGERLGKILRVDPATGAAPADNPFVATPGAAPEIWLYGVRNPWRFSFDRATGDLYVGDVGQDDWEEVDVLPAAPPGGVGAGAGANLGWDLCEGSADFDGSCTGTVPPALVYSHGEGCSVIGGFVYRGCALPGWSGTYFYADYCSAFVRTFVWDAAAGAVTNEMDLTAGLGGLSGVSTLGEDARGELYVADYAQGTVYRFVAQ
ncbi:MAG TPA: PQQ-dependent sugar dehydrogenase [Myxococcota bacterium]|nr:PQQ-dependent sugar dehydrogenase [Myxococcota bacterium]